MIHVKCKNVRYSLSIGRAETENDLELRIAIVNAVDRERDGKQSDQFLSFFAVRSDRAYSPFSDSGLQVQLIRIVTVNEGRYQILHFLNCRRVSIQLLIRKMREIIS